MRKVIILLGVFLISLTLVACGDDTLTVTPPTFGSIKVDESVPVVDGVLTTYHKGKSETLLIEVNINNPDGLLITSIIIDGYNYFASRFTDASTSNTIYFEMSTGTTLGEKVLSLDEIVYRVNNISKSVLVSANNEFKVYIYKNMPTVERESYAVTQDSITINFDISDSDEVIYTDKLIAELYLGEDLKDSKVITNLSDPIVFSELLSNKNYDVRIKADYNLDDSLGAKRNIVLYSSLFSTLDNSIPYGSFANYEVTLGSIDANILYIDENNVTEQNGLNVAIYSGDEVVPFATISAEEFLLNGFTGLFNNKEYTIELLSAYDLGDGFNVIDKVIASYTFTTLAKGLPEVSITGVQVEENRILFNFYIDDPETIIDKDTLIAKLYVDGDLVDIAAINEYSSSFEIHNLFSNYEFTIEIEASYDLNDGEGRQDNEVIHSQDFTTFANDAPSVLVEDVVVTQGYVTIILDAYDPNETLQGDFTAVLYEIYIDEFGVEHEVDLNIAIPFTTEVTELVFAYETSYLKGYKVEIIADYNLRDDQGLVEDAILFRSILLSLEQKAPVAEVTDIIVGAAQIQIDFKVMDSDITIDPGSIIASIYKDNELIETLTGISIGENSVTFENLDSDAVYEIRIEADYDLNDGAGLLEGQKLASETIVTLEKVLGTAYITNIIQGNDSIYIDVQVSDVDSTLVLHADGFSPTSLRVEIYKDGILDPTKTFYLQIGNTYNIPFTDLYSNDNYQIIIVSDYDLNDSTGIITGTESNILLEDFVTTIAKQAPVADFKTILTDKESITFTVDVNNDDDVINGVIEARLYIGDVYQNQSIDLSVGLNTKTFDLATNGVLSNQSYIIKVYTEYDLNEAGVAQFTEDIGYDFARTAQKQMITSEISNVLVTDSAITFDVEVFDLDSVKSGSLYAILLDSNYDPVVGSEIPLTAGALTSESFGIEFNDADYIIKVYSEYDLNELVGGAGAKYIATSEFVTTNTLSAPSATTTVTTTTNSRIDFEVNVVDSDSTIDSGLQAVLYVDGVATLNTIALNSGGILYQNLFFDDLEFGTDYEIVVEVNYMLNTPAQSVVYEVLDNKATQTVSIVYMNDVVINKRSITFELDVDDIFDVLVPVDEVTGVYVSLFYEDTTEVGQVIFVSELTDFDMLNLYSGYEYYIQVHADIGNVDPELVFEYHFTTLNLDVPDIQIVNLDVEDATDIVFDVVGVGDTDGIISGFVNDGTTPGTLEAVLFIDGVETATIAIPQDDTYTFSGYDGTDITVDYVIIIRATVNLNDSLGDITEYEFDTKSWIYATQP